MRASEQTMSLWTDVLRDYKKNYLNPSYNAQALHVLPIHSTTIQIDLWNNYYCQHQAEHQSATVSDRLSELLDHVAFPFRTKPVVIVFRLCSIFGTSWPPIPRFLETTTTILLKRNLAHPPTPTPARTTSTLRRPFNRNHPRTVSSLIDHALYMLLALYFRQTFV